jgi:hypothetical protein
MMMQRYCCFSHWDNYSCTGVYVKVLEKIKNDKKLFEESVIDFTSYWYIIMYEHKYITRYY